MAIDIKALLAKKKQIEAASNNSIWKPKAGENKVRIVPCLESPENPFQELKFTYPGGKTTLSPETFGKPDPIAEFGRALRAEGQLSKEDWQITKQYIPAERMYVTIVDRADEKAGVKFWAISASTFKEIVEIIANEEDYGDISDVKEGHDLIVSYTPKEKSPTKFAQTKVTARPRKTPLSDDSALAKKWLSEQPKLLDQFPALTYEELEKVLVSAVNGNKNEGEATPTPSTTTTTTEDDWGAPKSASVAKADDEIKTASAPKATTDSLADFAKLFENDK